MWRAMAVVVALMTAADVARADVFVPDDPAPHKASCVDAAGDVMVSARPDRFWRSIVELSEAGGPWRRVVRPRTFIPCPRVATAADGTAVVEVSSRLLVRRPGGDFGAPAAVGRGYVIRDVTAAPNGWVGVVGDRGRDLVATVLAPDGSTRETVLDRARNTRRRQERMLAPRIGLDGTGTATVAWTRWEAVTGRYDLRASTRGTARTLAAGARPMLDFPTLGQVDVAVSPAGHTVLAWADGRGVHASVDGAEAEPITTQRAVGSPTASIADDGSALVAYAAPRGRVLVSDRVPGAPWSRPHELGAGPDDTGSPGVPRQVELDSLLGPDGRGAVAWESSIDGRRQGLVAAAGRVGGGWSPAARVSLVTRALGGYSLTVGADGAPRLSWIESAHENRPGRLRGARLAETPGPPDTTAPVLTTELPARTPRTRTAMVRFPITVRCSEACDARVRLIHPLADFEMKAVARELPAGGQATLRLATPEFFAHQVLMLRRGRRARIEVVVSDRAGNVARQSRTVRYRIVPRSLLSFRVGSNHDFAMFTRAGNRAVGSLVNGLIAALASGEIEGFEQLLGRFDRGMRAIERRHDEVYDTAVGDEIFVALEVPLAREGYDAEALLGSI